MQAEQLRSTLAAIREAQLASTWSAVRAAHMSQLQPGLDAVRAMQVGQLRSTLDAIRKVQLQPGLDLAQTARLVQMQPWQEALRGLAFQPQFQAVARRQLSSVLEQAAFQGLAGSTQPKVDPAAAPGTSAEVPDASVDASVRGSGGHEVLDEPSVADDQLVRAVEEAIAGGAVSEEDLAAIGADLATQTELAPLLDEQDRQLRERFPTLSRRASRRSLKAGAGVYLLAFSVNLALTYPPLFAFLFTITGGLHPLLRATFQIIDYWMPDESGESGTSG